MASGNLPPAVGTPTASPAALPSHALQAFADLFTSLEERQEEWGIRSLGLSLTTIEEVFLKIAAQEDDEPPMPALLPTPPSERGCLSALVPSCLRRERPESRASTIVAVSVARTPSPSLPDLDLVKSPGPPESPTTADADHRLQVLKSGLHVKGRPGRACLFFNQFSASVMKRCYCAMRDHRTLALQVRPVRRPSPWSVLGCAGLRGGGGLKQHLRGRLHEAVRWRRRSSGGWRGCSTLPQQPPRRRYWDRSRGRAHRLNRRQEYTRRSWTSPGDSPEIVGARCFGQQ